MRFGMKLALSVALLAAAPYAAAVEGAAEVVTNELGALTRAKPRGSLEPVSVAFRDDAMRIDFQDANGKAFTMLIPPESKTGWIVGSEGGALPAPKAQTSLLYDANDPCAGKGMFANCQPMGFGIEAGREVRQWRYRFSDARGPGSTMSGQMWIDVETGFVLRYVGNARVGSKPREWRTTKIVYGPVPAGMLELDPARIEPRPGGME